MESPPPCGVQVESRWFPCGVSTQFGRSTSQKNCEVTPCGLHPPTQLHVDSMWKTWVKVKTSFKTSLAFVRSSADKHFDKMWMETFASRAYRGHNFFMLKSSD